MEALMVAFNKSIAAEFSTKLKRGASAFPAREPTPQQEEFFRTFSEQSSSILLEAVAGSGKTWTLLGASLSLPATQWTCKTMHGLGYSAWSNKIGRQLTVTSNKMFSLLKELEPAGVADAKAFSQVFGDILRLARIGKTFGIVPKIAPRGYELTPDDPDIWEELADNYEVEFSPFILDYARKLLAESTLQGQRGTVDFDDMLYLPVCYRGVFTKYPLVVVDEAQDLSSIQHEMLRKVIARNGLLVGAGDRHQAIYGFRGALSESIPTLVSTFDMQTLPLTVSFRCPQSVVAEAALDVPHIEAAPSAIVGEVIHHNDFNPLNLKTIPETVLCRNTAPLVSLSLRLIAAGRGAKIAGREVGKSLSRLVTKACAEPCPLRIFDDRLAAWVEAQIARKPGKEARLRDQQLAITAIANRAQTLVGPSATSEDIVRIIDQLYERDAPGAVTLSTIHKAKGLEWENVLMLDPQLIPSRYASQGWQLQQEHNIRYVGVTRAMRNLHYTTSEDIR